MTEAPRPIVLVIDDREDIVRFCERMLGDGYAFRHVTSGPEAAALLALEKEVKAVLVDRDFSQKPPAALMGTLADVRNEGLYILRWLRSEYPTLPVIMVTGHRDPVIAVSVSDSGADFLAWEDVLADPDILAARLERALESSAGGQDAILARFRSCGLIVESPSLARTLVALYRAIPGRAPILLIGETGTGKDSLAYAVHRLSGEAERAFVSVNVASLNPGLIESELFGHAKGAFTSAHSATIGKLRYAHGGTLFLNEIADLTPESQAKLLSALERGEVVPVGDVRSYPAIFRLITATSRDPQQLVETGRFRRDLFHRLAWHTIEIPPLRERREDIPALVNAFVGGVNQERERSVVGVAREAIEYLQSLPWEGNVRELRAVTEAACGLASHIMTVADVRTVVRRHEALSPRRRTVTPATAPGRASAQALSHRPDECEEAVFGNRSFREVTARYFAYLYRISGGRLAEVQKRAQIAKDTAYKWKERFLKTSEEPRGSGSEESPAPGDQSESLNVGIEMESRDSQSDV